MGTKEALTDLQMKGMNAVHKTVLKLSGGRVFNSFGTMPVV